MADRDSGLTLTDLMTGTGTPSVDPRGQRVIQSLREEYPDLSDVEDEDLLQAVHETVYPELEEEDFSQALRDVYAADIPETPEPPKPTVGGVLAGIGKAIWDDVTGLPRAFYQWGEGQRMLEAAEADPQFRGAHEALAKLDEAERNARRGTIAYVSMVPWFKSLALAGATGGAIYGSLTALNEGRAQDMLKEGAIGGAIGGVAAPAVGAVAKGLGKVLRGKPAPMEPPKPAPQPVTLTRPQVSQEALSEARAFAPGQPPSELGLPGPSPGRRQFPARPREELIEELGRPYQPERSTRRPMTVPSGPGWDILPGRASHAEVLADKPVGRLAGEIPTLYDDVAAGHLSPEEATARVMENLGMMETASPEAVEKLYNSFQHYAEASWEDIRLSRPPLKPLEPEALTPQPTNAGTAKVAEGLPVGSKVSIHNEPHTVAGYSESGKLQVTNQEGRAFEALISDVSLQTSGFGAWIDTLEAEARRRIAARGTTLFSNPVEQIADLALVEAVGAARLFRVGIRNMSQWSDDMIREFGAAIEPHLKELWTRSQAFLRKRILKSEEDLVDTKTLIEAFHQGRPGMSWYDDTWEELQSLVGPEDADMLARFLAATSAGRSSESNVPLALRAFANWKLGQDVAQGQIRTHRMQLLKAVRGESFGDLKVQNFYRALTGDENAVVIDRWMARVLGFKKDALKPEQYRFAVEVVKDLARDAGVTPRQFQAALWAAARGGRALELSKSGHQAKIASFKPLEQILRDRMGDRSVGEYAESLLPKAEMTAQSHWNNANRGINMALTTGGHTFNFHTMGPFQGSGYLTTVYNRVVPKDELTPQAILEVRRDAMALAKKYENQGQFTLGLYRSGDDMHIDFNMVLSTEAKALAVGRNMDQYAVGKIRKGSYEGDIPTGKPQDEPQRVVSLEEADAAIQSALGE